MREILFRGKSIIADTPNTLGYWLEGNFVESYYAYHIVSIEGTCLDLNEDSEVWPETVSQYIGIKDKNDKRIFEGDIVRFKAYRGEPHWIGTVTYDERNALYLFVGVMPYRYDSNNESPFEVQISAKDKDTFEVLGNRWDNPELLGEDGYMVLLKERENK